MSMPTALRIRSRSLSDQCVRWSLSGAPTAHAPPNVRGGRDGVGLRSCTLLAYVNSRPRIEVLLSSRYRATRRGCALTESGAVVVACVIRPFHGTTIGGGVHTLTVGGCLSDGWPRAGRARCPFRRRAGGGGSSALGLGLSAARPQPGRARGRSAGRCGASVGSGSAWTVSWTARPCPSVEKDAASSWMHTVAGTKGHTHHSTDATARPRRHVVSRTLPIF
jgi:hypothetical protein